MQARITIIFKNGTSRTIITGPEFYNLSEGETIKKKALKLVKSIESKRFKKITIQTI